MLHTLFFVLCFDVWQRNCWCFSQLVLTLNIYICYLSMTCFMFFLRTCLLEKSGRHEESCSCWKNATLRGTNFIWYYFSTLLWLLTVRFHREDPHPLPQRTWQKACHSCCSQCPWPWARPWLCGGRWWWRWDAESRVTQCSAQGPEDSHFSAWSVRHLEIFAEKVLTIFSLSVVMPVVLFVHLSSKNRS